MRRNYSVLNNISFPMTSPIFFPSTMFCWFCEDHYYYYNFKIIPDKRDIINALNRLKYCLDIFIWQCDFFITFDSWTVFMRSIYYFAFPDYLVFKPLVEKTILYFCILDWSLLLSHQFCFESGLTSIPSLSIQKKLVFNQKLVINKEKYLWGIWPIPN